MKKNGDTLQGVLFRHELPVTHYLFPLSSPDPKVVNLFYERNMSTRFNEKLA